jgi:hypothetical protein
MDPPDEQCQQEAATDSPMHGAGGSLEDEGPRDGEYDPTDSPTSPQSMDYGERSGTGRDDPVSSSEPFDRAETGEGCESHRLRGNSSADLPNPEASTDRLAFDLEARLWHECRPVIDNIRRIAGEDPSIRNALDRMRRLLSPEPVATTLARLLTTPPPDRWIVCAYCEGRGQIDSGADCVLCENKGYEYDPTDLGTR